MEKPVLDDNIILPKSNGVEKWGETQTDDAKVIPWPKDTLASIKSTSLARSVSVKEKVWKSDPWTGIWTSANLSKRLLLDGWILVRKVWLWGASLAVLWNHSFPADQTLIHQWSWKHSTQGCTSGENTGNPTPRIALFVRPSVRHRKRSHRIS